jgi:hypothetical protein
MAATHPAVPLPEPPKPLGLPELLDKAFRVYRRNFLFFGLMAVGVAIPDVVVELIWGSGALLGVVRVIYAPFALAVLFIGSTQVVIWNEADLKAVLWASFHRYLKFAGVLGAYVLVGISFLVPPLGLLVLVRWSLAAPSLAAEPIGIRQAVRRSISLVKGEWWRTFFTLSVIGILEIVIAVILAAISGVAVGFIPGLPEDVSLLAIGGAAVLAGSMAIPLIPISMSLLYVDLRVRKEGFDLDYLATSAANVS